jgi:hypothetical protein
MTDRYRYQKKQPALRSVQEPVFYAAHTSRNIIVVRVRAGGEKTQCEGDEGRFEINTSSLPRRILRGELTSSGRIRDTTSKHFLPLIM